jgi:hypothetical protein
MPWTYVQKTGHLIYGGELVATGYSGQPEAKNDPAREREKNLGPIPKGRWRIALPGFTHAKKGPVCLRLTPLPGTVTYGRDGFLIHGDSKAAPGTASHGCLIFDRKTRERIAASGDNELEIA